MLPTSQASGGPLMVTHFHCTNWPSNTNSPPSISSVLEMIEEVIKVQQSSTNKPVTVMCKSVSLLAILVVGSFLKFFLVCPPVMV